MSNAVGVGRRLYRLLGGLVAGALAVTAIAAISSAGSASAGTPDRFGFVLSNGTTVITSGTTPAGTSMSMAPAGVYQITFPGQASSGGVVHVTAINDAPHWCQVNSFGPSGSDEIVTISCHKVSATAPLDATPFSAIFSSSSGPLSTPGGSFGYVTSPVSGPPITSYNSTGGTNTVAHLTTGVWNATFPGLASSPGPFDGSWQATAASPYTVPMHCKVAKWSSSSSGQVAQIHCYNAVGAPADTPFTLTFQYQRSLYGGFAPPKNFGYLLNQPVGGPASTNFNFVAGTNTVSPGTVATVVFPKLAVPPDDIQVTAYGQSSDVCGLATFWGPSPAPDNVAKVNCFTVGGAPSASGFLISDNSRI